MRREKESGVSIEWRTEQVIGREAIELLSSRETYRNSAKFLARVNSVFGAFSFSKAGFCCPLLDQRSAFLVDATRNESAFLIARRTEPVIGREANL